jgi:molybdopterin/thiamine biosynthesis adenylyltransferase
MLTNEQINRYGRHIILPQIGSRGQEKLLSAKILQVGAGGLGSPIALYLAAAGIGTLGIMDGDTVDLSNLQRQIIHTTPDIGRLKVESARDKIARTNPNVKVVTYPSDATAKNIAEILEHYDLVIDCCDNFATRYLLNDAAILAGKPFIYGSVVHFYGQVTVFSQQGPCYRCLFPKVPLPGVAGCQEAGVLAMLPGIIGLIQATEAVKLLLGVGDSLTGRLLTFDALTMEFAEIEIARNPQCPVCGDNPSITKLYEENYFRPTCNDSRDL